MAYNVDFECSQVAGNVSSFTLTDTSTGSDGNLVSRSVSIYQSNGQLLVPVTDWPLADSTIDFNDVLPKDYSLNIQVIAVSSSPLAPPSAYTKELVVTFVGYINNFNYELVQQVAAGNPPLQVDSNFGNNFYSMFLYVDSATLATNYSDQNAAQQFITLAQYKITYENLFF